MSRPEVLVVECNKLASLTVNSVKVNMPAWDYKVVPYEGGFIATALKNIEKTALVVKSGVILDVNSGDLPSWDLLNEYDICLGRAGVFSDHPKHSQAYGLVGSQIGRKHLDLSVFIINPARWAEIPDSDSGVLQTAKRLRMPRHMNHKSDLLIANVLSGQMAMNYGMLAENASVFNYVDVFEKGSANGNEMFAYALEKALPFADELPAVKKLAERTLTRAAKLRVGLAKTLLEDTTDEH